MRTPSVSNVRVRNACWLDAYDYVPVECEARHLIFKKHNEKARQFVGLHLGAVS